jgi:hypothetical protein
MTGTSSGRVIHLRLRHSGAIREISCFDCLSNFISDAFNRRGIEQVTCLRASKAIISEFEVVDPPRFELRSVLFTKMVDLLLIVGKYCRIRFSRQDGSSDDLCAIMEHKSA